MSIEQVSHQGTLRGSYDIPMEQSASAGGPGPGPGANKPAAPESASRGKNDVDDSYRQSTHRQGSSPQGVYHADDPEAEELSDDSPEPEQDQNPGGLRKKTPKDSPAYVAPIGGIPKIDPIEHIEPSFHPTPPPEGESPGHPKKLPIYQIPKDHLVGKTIDEFGDILDDQGAVLGRVEGDLPSMVGRTISNARGDVLGDDGELLGYVAEVETGEGQQQESKQQPPTWDLAEVMKAMAAAGQGPGGLRVDPFGNILDAEGNVVGSFHDNKTGFGKKAHDGNSGKSGKAGKAGKGRSKQSGSEQKDNPPESGGQAESSSEYRPRENAQSHRKEPEERKPSPSDIFLDVKSTTEGIQLTIRIPTVFNSSGQPTKPKIVFE
ncbi:hypothetical protein KVR01_003396 [Diaporthe batatas]|uniref:uncharacterized protein n=1 Tax=Diaporthe batatas TaxID=748121 RepID=UPI001D043D52|nr:uncharacterized protein KVR01_003396 [Diaporthe batatas]KAG8167707.1 hypothetical protein KVR01_003396 [Diaporthe batatas]